MKILNVFQVAEKTGRSPATIRHHLGRGQFPNAYKLGRDWCIPDNDVRRFLRNPPKEGRAKGYPALAIAAKKQADKDKSAQQTREKEKRDGAGRGFGVDWLDELE